jgi:hypothetical protein
MLKNSVVRSAKLTDIDPPSSGGADLAAHHVR